MTNKTKKASRVSVLTEIKAQEKKERQATFNIKITVGGDNITLLQMLEDNKVLDKVVKAALLSRGKYSAKTICAEINNASPAQ